MADGANDVNEAEALEQHIEQTREDLAVTVDELVDRVSPKRVAGRTKDRVADKVRGVVGAVKEKVASLRSGSGEEPTAGSADVPGPVRARRTAVVEGTAAPVATGAYEGHATYEVQRRPVTPLLAGVAGAGTLLLGVLLRRRRKGRRGRR